MILVILSSDSSAKKFEVILDRKKVVVIEHDSFLYQY